MKRSIILLPLALLACQDGRPNVVDAAITVSPSTPMDLANIDVELDLLAVDTQEILSLRTGLYDGFVFDVPPTVALEMTWPADFDAKLAEGERRTVHLVNEGTTNAQLAPHCDKTFTLFVHIDDTGDPSASFVEEPHKANVTRPFRVMVGCEKNRP